MEVVKTGCLGHSSKTKVPKVMQAPGPAAGSNLFPYLAWDQNFKHCVRMAYVILLNAASQ